MEEKEKKSRLKTWVKVVIGIPVGVFAILFILVIIGAFLSNGDSTSTSVSQSNETEQEKIERIVSNSNTPSYKQLKKNADNYKGVSAIYEGKVVQAQEGSNTTHLRVEVTKGEYDIWKDVVFVVYDGLTDVVEDDIVKVYGILQGDYQYESQAGWKISVPRLDAEVIQIVKKSEEK